MATRGREANRLYVDTPCDLDAANSHGEAVEIEPIEVLRAVVITSGAHTSATTVRQAEKVAARAPCRLEAQDAALHQAHHGSVSPEI